MNIPLDNKIDLPEFCETLLVSVPTLRNSLEQSPGLGLLKNEELFIVISEQLVENKLQRDKNKGL